MALLFKSSFWGFPWKWPIRAFLDITLYRTSPVFSLSHQPLSSTTAWLISSVEMKMISSSKTIIASYMATPYNSKYHIQNITAIKTSYLSITSFWQFLAHIYGLVTLSCHKCDVIYWRTIYQTSWCFHNNYITLINLIIIRTCYINLFHLPIYVAQSTLCWWSYCTSIQFKLSSQIQYDTLLPNMPSTCDMLFLFLHIKFQSTIFFFSRILHSVYSVDNNIVSATGIT